MCTYEHKEKQIQYSFEGRIDGFVIFQKIPDVISFKSEKPQQTIETKKRERLNISDSPYSLT